MDPSIEIWKPISNYENFYEVSSFGRVRSLDRILVIYKGSQEIRVRRKSKILKAALDTKKYLIIILCNNKTRKTSKVHRLVAESFIPNPQKKDEVNHKDGNKENNYYLNLEWVTQLENIQHAITTGLRKTGRDNPQCKSGIQIIDKNNNIICTVYGSNELEACGLGLDRTRIFKILKGFGKSHKGFTFKKIEK